MARPQQVVSPCKARSYYARKLRERAGVTLIVLAIFELSFNGVSSGFKAAGEGAS